MAYTPVTFVDGVTPLNAANLNKLEDGVEAHDLTLEGRLGADAEPTSDWNNAVENGWWVSATTTAANSPQNGIIWGGRVFRSGSGVSQRVYQEVWNIGGGAAAARQIRYFDGSSWSPWTPASSGGGADLSYDGDWVAGTYQDGDVVVKDGIAYLCVGGPTTVAPDPAPWGAGRPTKESELAYAELVVNATGTQTTDATAGTILTLPAVALDGLTPIDIDVSIPLIQHTAASYVIVSLWDGSTQIGRIGSIYAPSANNGEPFRGRVRLTPSAGSHSYTIRVHGGSAGTWTVVAQTGGAGGYLQASVRINIPSSPIPIIPGASLPVSYGTTLPVSPVDGQEAILVDSLTGVSSYQWRFRYNAGSTTGYRWECVGGTPYRAFEATSVNPSGWTALGPTLTAPRAGIYRCTVGAHILGPVSSSNQIAVAGGSKIVLVGVGVTGDVRYAQATEDVTVTAGATLSLSVSGAGAASNRDRSIDVVPLRVA